MDMYVALTIGLTMIDDSDNGVQGWWQQGDGMRVGWVWLGERSELFMMTYFPPKVRFHGDYSFWDLHWAINGWKTTPLQ